ncbi:unnamed protein product [Bursaphelenchus okinawaensis]|uniref:Uncharacterized protein n=1 Tax=Bursaphelenchus okinawaensis TaxID=465554 RepID=A0A811L6B3_9BILA|nr:unnamed protein product [Bursaphelenchus okinawaensis]CAG9118383.1 unnamed protein product [Bursaphelenchus okinawaensis]
MEPPNQGEYNPTDTFLKNDFYASHDYESNAYAVLFNGKFQRRGASSFVLIYQVIDEGLGLADTIRPDDIRRITPHGRFTKVEFSSKKLAELVLMKSARLRNFKINDRPVKVMAIMNKRDEKIKRFQDWTIFRLREMFNLQVKDVSRVRLESIELAPNSNLNLEPCKVVLSVRDAAQHYMKNAEQQIEAGNFDEKQLKQYKMYRELATEINMDDGMGPLVRSMDRGMDMKDEQETCVTDREKMRAVIDGFCSSSSRF